MYVPAHFREERPDVLAAAIRDIQLATLVTAGPDGLVASHVPMVLKESESGLELHSHVARPNGHWRAAGGGQESLAIFQGPQSYITPSWYESKRRHGKVVPTWTYIAVHASGPLAAVNDEEWIARHLDDLTRANEEARPAPWAVTDAPAEFIANLSRAIVGLVLKVESLEGAWKLNQHRPEDDRIGTIQGLETAAGPGSPAVAAAMRERERERAVGSP